LDPRIAEQEQFLEDPDPSEPSVVDDMGLDRLAKILKFHIVVFLIGAFYGERCLVFIA
jgi:hypothetical protein